MGTEILKFSIRMKEEGSGLFYSEEPVVKVNAEDVRLLKDAAKVNPRKKARICGHRDVHANLHEMLIVHGKGAYVRPHKHLNKVESFHVIEGSADVVLFHEDGEIKDVIHMGDYASGKKFYYRLSDPFYHALIIRSEVFVFHEVTNGPFDPSHTLFAPWSPEEGDDINVNAYLKKLSAQIDTFAVAVKGRR